MGSYPTKRQEVPSCNSPGETFLTRPDSPTPSEYVEHPQRLWPMVGDFARIPGLPAGPWRVEVTSPNGLHWSAEEISQPRQVV